MVNHLNDMSYHQSILSIIARYEVPKQSHHRIPATYHSWDCRAALAMT